MNTDYILLLLAVICLWTPGSIIASAEVKRKVRQSSRRQHDGLISLLRSKFNWLDLIRAALGVWLIKRQIASFHTADEDTRNILTAAQVLVLLVGAVAQTLWLDRRVSVIGPVFYLTGLTFMTCGPIVGGFGLVLGINCALMLRRLSSCFILVPVSIGAFGLMFHQIGILTVVSAGLLTIPIVLAFATHKRLSFVRRSSLKNRRKSVTRPHVLTSKHVFDGETIIPEKEMVPSNGFSDGTTYTATGRSRLSETW